LRARMSCVQSQVAAIYRADRQTAGERCVKPGTVGGGGCGQPDALAAERVGRRRRQTNRVGRAAEVDALVVQDAGGCGSVAALQRGWNERIG
jgi:hypothetical protein